MLPTVDEGQGYDFLDPENTEKWRGMLVNPLRKVLEQVHPVLTADEEALLYVESLCFRVLGMLCSTPSPLTVQDVEERVTRCFPAPLHRWALADAQRKKRTSLLPTDKLHHLLREVLTYKMDQSVSHYIACIVEYVSGDVLKLAGNFIKKISQHSLTISSRDIETAMCADKVLMEMFFRERGSLPPELASGTLSSVESLTYGELCRDLIMDERNFIRELNLIIRVFKDELEKIADPQAISLIFGNVVDVYEVATLLLGNLEDAMEMSQGAAHTYIGSCFEELAEVEEFRAFVRYANIVTKKESRDALQAIVDDPELGERLDTATRGFRLAVKYLLPALLLTPLRHVSMLHAYCTSLYPRAQDPHDAESFKQVECNLLPIKKLVMKELGGNGNQMDTSLRFGFRARRQLAAEKCNELSRLVLDWETSRTPGQTQTEFIREDTLTKISSNKRLAERRAYLFDGVLLLCKPQTSLVTVNPGPSLSGSSTQLKLKETLCLKKLEVKDKPDTDEFRNCMELVRCEPGVGSLVLQCSSSSDKRAWMADLISLTTAPTLDRILQSILSDISRRHPLRLPPVEEYRFSEPDSPHNIVFDANNQIKGATLLKLVERLTYHVTADLSLLKTFLTTYRSFCKPRELMALLGERFRIPSLVHNHLNDETGGASDADKLSKNTTREDWKRYRKEFVQPVQFRVINVLRQWVDQHFYDFESDPELLATLREFLETIDDKHMKKWVNSVLRVLNRRQQCVSEEVSHVFSSAPPPTLRHPAPGDPNTYKWHILALHPCELARQATLLEFALYRLVKPSELVGAVWTKKDKEKTSPNLLKIIKHTTNFTRWIEKCIVETENLEERAAVMSRCIETGHEFLELNNFNGALGVAAALASAACHRLKHTHQMLSPRLQRTLETLRSLSGGHCRRYTERLRSINPPCVPFFGVYLTNILHTEEGNQDFLPDSELINFSKRRMVADITGEIQQYQNQPYCLTTEPKTRAFLESLDPFPGMDDTEITNYLYNKSLEIEPRSANKQLPKFPRKFPELSLKPLKISRRVHHDSHHSTSSNNDDNISICQVSPPGGWDSHDDTRSISAERGVATSPRLERSLSQQLTLLDKGLALFDTRHRANTASKCVGSKDEPPSPRDSHAHSPRHEQRVALSPRGAIVDSELFYSRLAPPTNTEKLPPLLPRNSATTSSTMTLGNFPTNNFHSSNMSLASLPNNLSNVPSNITSVPSNISSVTNSISSVHSSASNFPSNLSSVPNSISNLPSSISNLHSSISNFPSNLSDVSSNISNVPSNLSLTPDSLSTTPNSSYLSSFTIGNGCLPNSSVVSSNNETTCDGRDEDKPPELPPRAASPPSGSIVLPSSKLPSPLSPRHHDLVRLACSSPRRSPAPSPHARTMAFHFPSKAASPSQGSGAAPPLPPRRRRDPPAPPGPPAPDTPPTPHPRGAGSRVEDEETPPPPRPPRTLPPAPPPLGPLAPLAPLAPLGPLGPLAPLGPLGPLAPLAPPAQSALLQRRHTSNIAPKLPPKPPPPAVAPRT